MITAVRGIPVQHGGKTLALCPNRNSLLPGREEAVWHVLCQVGKVTHNDCLDSWYQIGNCSLIMLVVRPIDFILCSNFSRKQKL